MKGNEISIPEAINYAGWFWIEDMSDYGLNVSQN